MDDSMKTYDKPAKDAKVGDEIYYAGMNLIINRISKEHENMVLSTTILDNAPSRSLATVTVHRDAKLTTYE